MRRAITIPAVILYCASAAFAALSATERQVIDTSTGAKGAYSEKEDTHKVSFPRIDIKVTVEGRPMAPFLGLTSWAAFTSLRHEGLMVMGDVVLLEDEVNPAMSAALDAGLEVTALHNHFFYESPRVMFMHIGGRGTADRLALAVRSVLDAVKAVRAAAPVPATRFGGQAVSETSAISAPVLDSILGVKGDSNSGMYKATIGRQAAMHGASVSTQMGVNTWAAFAGTDQWAFVDGDFAMTKDELQPVLKALRKAGIHIVAIHNHMTHEEPQYVFLHYWGKGPAAVLARGLRGALDLQGPRAGAQAPRNILFVCEHGAAKSVIAAAEFNRLAEQRGLPWRATARGTNPDDIIAVAVAQALGRDGMPAHGKPTRVTSLDVENSAQVITFGLTLPVETGTRSVRDWADVPSPSADLGAAREDIRRRVTSLLEELAKKP